MANAEHVAILKQGAAVWNKWRNDYPNVQPDLFKADLSNVDLSYANLSDANLRGIRLYSTRLYEADLRGADLRKANFYRADLRKAYIGYTVFGDVNLSVVHGLAATNHDGPSTIGIDTIIRSHGKIPEKFLRGAGVPDSIIKQIPILISSLNPIEYYSCFISYSSKDDAFAKRLHADLQSKGVLCWFALHDMRTGQRIRYGINEAIRQYDKLILILSKDSIASTWVEFEVETALDKEKSGSEVLFPIRLDSAVLECSVPWASHLKRTRHIGDFTNWKSHDEYQKALDRLLRDLEAEAETTEV